MPLLLLPPPTTTSNTFPTSDGALSARLAVEWSPTTLPGATPVWVDITAYVRHVSTDRGRQHDLDRFEAGTATLILDNRTRLFDPTYTAGTYYGNILPMRPFRIRGQYNNVTYPMFMGYVESWTQRYERNRDAVCEVTLVDAFKVFALQAPKSPWSLTIEALNPTAWFRMSEEGTTVLLDSGQNGYDGTHTNTPTLGATGLVASDTNQAITYVAASSEQSSTTAIPGFSQWHGVELWFSTSAAAAQTMVIVGDSTGRPMLAIELDASGHLVFTEYWVAADVTNHKTTTTTYNDGNRHHVWCGIVPNGAFVAGVDGALATITSNPAVAGVEFLTAANTWTFGSRGNGTQYFDGTLDEVVVYVDDVWSPTISNGGELFTGFQAAMETHYAAGTTPWNGDLTGARADRILDAMGWPATERDISDGASTLQAANFGTNSVFEEFARMNMTELGRLFVDRQGRVALDGRYDALGTSPSATFGDAGGSEVPYLDVAIDYDDLLLRNSVLAQRDNGTEVLVADETSQATYYVRSYSATNLLYQDDEQTLAFARVILSRYKDPFLRVSSLVVVPERSPSLCYPQVLGREIGDVITVTRRPQGVGDAIAEALMIDGISHDIVPSGEWVTTFQLTAADTAEFWVLGNSVAGILGTTTVLGF